MGKESTKLLLRMTTLQNEKGTERYGVRFHSPSRAWCVAGGTVLERTRSPRFHVFLEAFFFSGSPVTDVVLRQPMKHSRDSSVATIIAVVTGEAWWTEVCGHVLTTP